VQLEIPACILQVRLLAVSVAVLAAARFSPAYLSSKALGFVHLIAFGTFLGTNIWTTFVAGLTMFKNLPRQVQICLLWLCCSSDYIPAVFESLLLRYAPAICRGSLHYKSALLILALACMFHACIKDSRHFACCDTSLTSLLITCCMCKDRG